MKCNYPDFGVASLDCGRPWIFLNHWRFSDILGISIGYNLYYPSTAYLFISYYSLFSTPFSTEQLR
ncbi:hypothetical protein BDV28DRAFT_139602 [Aspergillus coremiiformis]|uniref:Uncharacterized protein n=1 Tax=Aspergillus coremiiformis TaxID=138285 RepID=A0A5N6YXN3_9EURO|nr:hypothetical protein BDV28DRAFT_139602 [Aspergillus coremiiformis]